MTCGAGTSPALLADIKNYLNITWEDEATDRKVANLTLQGMAYLTDKAGGEPDFFFPGYPRTLLFEYVRYARDSALDVFENNYMSMLLGMQTQRQVSQYVESSETT